MNSRTFSLYPQTNTQRCTSCGNEEPGHQKWCQHYIDPQIVDEAMYLALIESSQLISKGRLIKQTD